MAKLFSRKKSSAETPAAQTTSAGGAGLAHLNLLSLAVAVLVLFASGYMAYLQYASLITSRQEDNSRAEAEHMAAWLSGHLSALGEEVTRMARADPELLAAIAAEDRETIIKHEQQLMQYFPEALRTRFILPSDNRPDESLQPPLGYACLELARSAEHGGTTPPFEVHMFGGEAQHLDLVRPVRSGDRVVASLMVTLDVTVLKQWIDRLNPQGGYVELQQGIGSDTLNLFGRGNATAKGDEGFSATVADSRWLITYWPAGGIGVAEARTIGFLMTFAIGAVLLAALFILYGLFLSRYVQADMRRLINYIVDSSLGKRFHSYPVKLNEAKKALQQKENELSVLSSYTKSTDDVHAKAKDYVPDIAFLDDGITVEEEDTPAQEEGDTREKP